MGSCAVASDVRINLLVKVGSKMENYGQSDIAHLPEHMLFLKAGQRENVRADLAALVIVVSRLQHHAIE